MTFTWKCAMQTFRIIDVRVLVRIAMLFVLSVAGASVGQKTFVAAFAMFALTGALFSMPLAPQALRIDMRQDLQHLELIKMWPLRARHVVRGEMIWPASSSPAWRGR
jgi:hypothetical protein